MAGGVVVCLGVGWVRGLAVHGEQEAAEALGEAVEGEGCLSVGREVVLREGYVKVLYEDLVMSCHGEFVLLCGELGAVRGRIAG